ncbi:hypothetical protein H2200_012859 [Cladophialophora chaetospira]|uniref:Heterokaryon incompatibility domain-containing protein n=1 Tax=Cladophialophora chaetospira TaxID=386627 RepID=A0AA38WWY1_9EURO|nr:hypothetical protein H2200_012859 [Cladophialophora chaetospira]
MVIPDDFQTACYVEYTIDSRDQGFCDDANSTSYSWFEASVRRPHDRNNLRSIRICDNRIGNPNFRRRTAERWTPTHPWRVTWNCWVQELRPGDVIESIPRAMYPGWLNIIQYAEIKIEYEAKRISKQLRQQLRAPCAQDHPLFAMPLDPDSRQIRVLELDGKPGTQETYDAVSYVCGTSEDRDEISVQLASTGAALRECKLSIIPLAAAAIRHLRHHSTTTRLWVDCACINQDDVKELALQVQAMGPIFSRARRVHVWLGSEHAGIKAALRIARDAYNVKYRSCEGGSACNCTGTRHTAVTVLQAIIDRESGERPNCQDRRTVWSTFFFEHNERGTTGQDLRAVFQHHWSTFEHNERAYAGGNNSHHVSKLMSHLFDHSWFRRVWCLQEALKSRDASVHCGREVITWKEMFTVNSWLASEDFIRREPHLHSLTVTMPRIWSRLADASAGASPFITDTPFSSQDLPGLTVLDVFTSSLDLKATDPRDKIFAILSLGRDTCAEAELSHWIRPNYEKTVARVFADFTRWWIHRYRSLSILSLIHSHRTRTWQRLTCDMDQSPSIHQPTWAVPSEGRERWARATLEAHSKFRAAGNTAPDLDLLKLDHDASESDGLVIRLKGYRVGEIEDIQHLSLENQDSAATLVASELFECFHSIFDPSNTEEHWKTGTASGSWATFVRLQQDSSRLNNHLFCHAQEGQEVLAIDPLSSGVDGVFVPSLTSWSPACGDPCFFSTVNGMLGLCPWTACRGDTTALLQGANVPYLLRPHPQTDSFDLVGECLVMGIMHGEFLHEQTERGVPAQVFTIS